MWVYAHVCVYNESVCTFIPECIHMCACTHRCKYACVLTYMCLWAYVLFRYGEGNGTPLQYSCLENPMDRGAWWAVVHGVARSPTQLSDFLFTFHFHALEKEMATHSCSCLENPRNGGAWWAAVYGVTQSRTQLKWLSSSIIQVCLLKGHRSNDALAEMSILNTQTLLSKYHSLLKGTKGEKPILGWGQRKQKINLWSELNCVLSPTKTHPRLTPDIWEWGLI